MTERQPGLVLRDVKVAGTLRVPSAELLVDSTNGGRNRPISTTTAKENAKEQEKTLARVVLVLP